MRIALYGGSFNPPHVGHAMVASWIVWTGQADAVWWAPSFSHPFAKDLVPFDVRVGLLRTMLQTLGGPMHVCALESEMDTPSYTIDLLDELSRRHPEHSFRLVLGSDNLPTFSKWKESERLKATYAPIVVGRAGYDNPSGVVVFPGVSSTQVREQAATGELRGLVCASIHDEVVRLYSVDRSSGPKPIQP